jgi:predicted Zn-dependent peptidase
VTEFDNGLTLWSYDLPGQYVVSATVVLPVPLTAEPVTEEGVATLAVRALDEGTLAHPGFAYAAELEAIGAQYSGWVSSAATATQLEVPAQWLPTGLTLFAEALTSPAFDPADIDRLIANRLAELTQLQASGRQLASWLIRSTIVAAGQRAARPVGGSHATVAALSAPAVRAFHDRHYGPDQAILVVAGDLSGYDLPALAETAFGDWRRPVERLTADLIQPGQPQQRLVNRPSAVQSDIRLGWFGLDRQDPRFPAFQVAAMAMGGGFSSRLNQVLRETHGWTYDVSLSNRPFQRGGYVSLAASTQTGHTRDLIDEARRLIRLDDTFTQAEVDDAIGFLVSAAPLSYATADAVAGQAVSLASHGLDHGLVNDLFRSIAEVTPETATEVWRSVIDPDQASLVVLGDGEALAEPLGLTPEPIPVL